MTMEITTIHMIDDSEDDAYLTSEFFRRQAVGPALDHTYHYQDFLDRRELAGEFDLRRSIVVIDLNLRSQRGSDVIREFRAKHPGDDLIIGICSGSRDPEDLRVSIAAGADFYIEKPLNRAALESIASEDERLTVTSGTDEPLAISRIV